MLTVSETSADPPQDEGNSINSPNNLALEATYINHNLAQQVLRMVNKNLSLKKIKFYKFIQTIRTKSDIHFLT